MTSMVGVTTGKNYRAAVIDVFSVNNKKIYNARPTKYVHTQNSWGPSKQTNISRWRRRPSKTDAITKPSTYAAKLMIIKIVLIQNYFRVKYQLLLHHPGLLVVI